MSIGGPGRVRTAAAAVDETTGGHLRSLCARSMGMAAENVPCAGSRKPLQTARLSLSVV
jgi:hypothetical protein